MDRTVAVLEFIFCEVGLTGHAVETAVFVEFNVAGVKTRLEKLFDSGLMARFGCTNEVVV